MRNLLAFTAAIAALIVPGAATAHHSFAMFDRTKEVELRNAVVVRWEWTNPHVWLFVTAPPGRAGARNYSIEGGSTGLLRRQGWQKASLKPGDRVTVYISPLKNGELGGSLLGVVLPNGRMLGARLDQLRSSE